MAKKDFLTIADLSPGQLQSWLDDAVTMKQMQQAGTPHPYLAGQVLGMIFEKASTRTRVSFEVAMLQLGGEAIFLSSQDIQLGRGETIGDTAQVLSRYVDGIMIRTFGHDKLEELATYASVPVINGLTDDHHPCQVLADLLTILEHKGRLKGLKLCYIGDGNNMANSLLEGAVRTGMDISVATPKGYEPNSKVVAAIEQEAQHTGSAVVITHDPQEAIAGSDVVYTDVWASMGQEEEQSMRLKQFEAYQVSETLCKQAKDDYIFLHCLPAHRGEEVTAGVMDGSHSVVFDQAENRLHAQKAVLKALMIKS